VTDVVMQVKTTAAATTIIIIIIIIIIINKIYFTGKLILHVAHL